MYTMVCGLLAQQAKLLLKANWKVTHTVVLIFLIWGQIWAFYITKHNWLVQKQSVNKIPTIVIISEFQL